MGSTQRTIIICVLLLLGASAVAESAPCIATTSEGSPFAICFDVGNRLALTAGSQGVGGGIRLRHAIRFDDEPDLSWKLDHRILDGSVLGVTDFAAGVVYSGRFLRHSRDGHIVLPLLSKRGRPRKIFVPFDIGAEAQVGRFRLKKAGSELEIEAIRVAALIDLHRSPGFRRRLSVGIVARWDTTVDIQGQNIEENKVAPLSIGSLGGYLESSDGMRSGEFSLEGGRIWSTNTGWEWRARGQLIVEQVIVAINDRPLSIVIEGNVDPLSRSAGVIAFARFGILSASRSSQ